ncbi:pyruvate kinase [Megasphaera paucivorans]|uniref:Pyruvate kinase n=1 Tax=Megasphaera paucivorans TaxID=349095 RepID=A0A1G9XLQ6_9FIRM|nr:pyruvate kinase [Megasphaera paucivorans]SDM97125.1 pyruvate kinase [Megasphaera paucivorans]
MLKKTKIVCTLGPSSDSPEILDDMLRSGMNVARFNFSHGSHEEHKARIDGVRAASKRTGVPVALMLDTKGPEIRLGLFENGSIQMEAGKEFILTARDVKGTETIASMSYKNLPKEVKVGDHILLSDGLVNLEVIRVEGDDIHTKILNKGKMSDRKRVAVPGVAINLPAVSDTDIKDIEFGISKDMDFIAASFIQRGEDVVSIRKILEKHGNHMQIISKIECQAAVQNIDEIIKMSDGLMVARGDLGVEVPAEEVPMLQKMLINKCHAAGKPVITATQMLESMCTNPRPTRAETSDVANAIIDGTDAIMLSGETAGGSYPAAAVQTMERVALFTESHFVPQETRLAASAGGTSTTDSIGRATVTIADNLHAAAIIASTEKGGTAQIISKYRPACPIIAVSPHKHIVRRLLLNWGIQPVLGEKAADSDELVDKAIYAALNNDLIKTGDLVVLTAGVPVGIEGTTNMVRVQIVGDVVLRGTGLGKKTSVGKVCVASDETELADTFEDGCILVIKSAETGYMKYISRAGALISEEEGLTSPSAVAALTLGVPCVVGAKDAVSKLKNGEVVTVDGTRGTIYRGVTNAR